MHPYRLRVFCTAVECGSFSRAAAELFITQPAVSQHVRALEKELQVRLVERGGGAWQLTDAGEIVYRFAQRIRASETEMRQLLQALQVGERGRVVLGASSTGVLYYLPPVLRRLRADYPGIDLTLFSDITDRLRTAVIDGSADAALVWGPVADPRLLAKPLHRAPFAVVAAADHPLAEQPLVTPIELSAYPFVMNLQGTTTRQVIEAALRGLGVSLQVAMEGTSTENIKKVAEAGLALALVCRRAVDPEISLGTLRVLTVAGLDLQREITLIVRAERQLPPPAARVRRFLGAAGAAFQAQDDPHNSTAAFKR